MVVGGGCFFFSFSFRPCFYVVVCAGRSPEVMMETDSPTPCTHRAIISHRIDGAAALLRYARARLTTAALARYVLRASGNARARSALRCPSSWSRRTRTGTGPI